MNNEFDIAIVGMSCRFPGARTLDEFWQNLAGGVESIARLTDEEILNSGVPASCLENPTYVKAAPILQDAPGDFDAGFFGFSPGEARTLDPQHRILLELAHEALEDAGYNPDGGQQRIGVFTGSAMNTYFMNAGLSGRFAEEYIPTLIANDKDFLSTRISYKLNLKGPSITVQTACSTSLVAVHLARQSLLSGETDMVMAGAISVRVPHRAGYFADAGGVTSPDGHVRAFDSRANGTVFGSGGGIIVMRRLADALRDGDTIHAVIRGSAVNNDGSEKASYTAPSVNSQAEAVVEALANADVEADSISYIEAHGSGTPVGDPIEISALTKAFRTLTQRSGYCAIGSVKTNIGHLDAAAGIAGVIKTVLALKHRKLPASLHFSEANPEIDFPATPFYVNTRLREWTGEAPRRAGVMSTGMGGTNAHVILEEAPDVVSTGTKPPYLLILSAKTETALDQATNRLRDFLNRNDSVKMSEVAYTLQIGRKSFRHRRCLVSVDRADAIAALGQAGSKRVLTDRTDELRRPLILLLPGIGDHYAGMAYDLYESWPVFKQEVDQCSHILEQHLGIDIRTIIYPNGQSWKKAGQIKGIDLKQMLSRKTDAPEDQDTRNLNRTLFAQPALFTIEYAMTRLWQSLGITPDAIIGHSMGEYVAACLSGVMSLHDALQLIATRAKLVNELPEGAMLAVMVPEHELLSLLPEDLSISLINGPSLCVVAGPIATIAEFEQTLTTRSVLCRHVQNAHAFHSRMLDPIVNAFEAEVTKVQLNEPRIPYVSNVTGKWITGREATSPAYWAMHANHTARFSDALHELWHFKNPILLEAGPGRTLGVLAMQHPDRRDAGDALTVSSIRHNYENQSDVEFLLHGIGRLWLSGTKIKWDNVQMRERRRVPLPTYPFERQNYWLETKSSGVKKPAEQTPVSENSGIDNWFYVPTWERTPIIWEAGSKSSEEKISWLVFSDRWGGGTGIQRKLEERGAVVQVVRFGEKYHRRKDGTYEITPAGPDDYVKLFRELNGKFLDKLNIIHLGCLTRNSDPADHVTGNRNEDFGFFSLLYIAQAIGELSISIPIRIGIISNQIHKVTGEESLDPDMATVLGPCGVIPKEFPNVSCFNLDLLDPQVFENVPDDFIGRIVSEFRDPSKSQVLAYRGKHRWKRRYERVDLPIPAVSGAPELKRLRNRGVYLITGGTGGLGLAFAKYLAKTCQAKLVLTKKTAFPEKLKWKELLSSKEAPEPVIKTIKELLEIERLGAEVEVFVAEASDEAKMRAVVNETLKRFQAINGVIHAAGIVRPRLIQSMTKEMADSVLSPKVHGTMILFDLLREANLDFMVLFSSMSSVIGPYAHADYSAANCFLDAFAAYSNSLAKFHTLAINWPVWKEVGIGAGSSYFAQLEVLLGVEDLQEQMLKKAILTNDGVEVFKRSLNSDLAQIIVSPESLNPLLEESRSPSDFKMYLSRVQNSTKFPPQDSSQRNGASQPANKVEGVIAEIWESVFGLEQIGIDDNFSQLGGHSLLAMQIVAKIRSSYQIGFTLREFFAAPSIAQLAVIVKARIRGEGESPANDQARPLVAPMGQRLFRASRMEKAIFFGPTNQQVFAIYNPPAGGSGRVLTVVCPPLFNEYMRTHLALRELAISLAERGQHVLRFDYRGTGDSFGDLDEVTISDWLEDVALAMRKGCELSGSKVVQLLGVRGGALLACRAAGASRDVQRLVLWDPIADGASYLQALRRIQVAIIERDLCLNHAELGETLHEYAGHRLSERMLEEFRLLDAGEYSSVPKKKLYVVSTSSEAGFPVPAVAQKVARFACNWETDLDNLIMPKTVLERLSECLTLT